MVIYRIKAISGHLVNEWYYSTKKAAQKQFDNVFYNKRNLFNAVLLDEMHDLNHKFEVVRHLMCEEWENEQTKL